MNHPAPAEFDECLTDWSVTDAEAIRKCFRDKSLPSPELPVEYVREDGADDRLSAKAVVERGVRSRLQVGHVSAARAGNEAGWACLGDE